MIKKSLDMIMDLEKDEDESKYIQFWNNFGKYLKVGVVEDDMNKFEIAPLLRFTSSSSKEEYRSLEEYVSDMPESQKAIYYITATSKEMAMNSPILEKVISRGYEVLFMVEPLDEICVQSLARFRDHDLVDVTKEGLDFGDAEKKEANDKEAEVLNEEFKPVIEYMEALLAGKIQKVTMTTLLTNSPAALVQGQYGMSPSMQKYMKAQSVALGEGADMSGGMNQAILELNPNHVLVTDLKQMIEKDEVERENFAMLLYDVAGMTSGYEIGNVSDFAKRVMTLMNPASVTEKTTEKVQEAEVVSDEPDLITGPVEAVIDEEGTAAKKVVVVDEKSGEQAEVMIQDDAATIVEEYTE